MSANPAITTARPSLPSAIHADDVDILAGRPLRPGSEHSMLSRFGEDVWDLSPAMFRANARPAAFRVDFGAIADPALRRLAKEYMLARLQAPLRSYRGPCGPSTAKGTLLFLRHFGELVRQSRLSERRLIRLQSEVPAGLPEADSSFWLQPSAE